MIAQVDAQYLRLRPMAALRRVVTRGFFEGRPLTTKARWLNWFYFRQFALLKRLPIGRSGLDRPVFIIGVGRSGTTILGTLLSLHPHVGFLNEPKALWHAVMPDEDVLGHYSQGAARYRLLAADATPMIQRDATRLFTAYLRTIFANRLLDKNPELTFRVPFIKALFPTARFIFLVRNGWNTSHSIAKWTAAHTVYAGNDKQDWWGINDRKWHHLIGQLVKSDSAIAELAPLITGTTREIERAALEWIVTMRAGLAAQREAPEAIQLVRYEELINSPRETLQRLFNFCDLPYDDKLITYAESTVRPSAEHGPFEMHAALLPHFLQTMSLLGYQ